MRVALLQNPILAHQPTQTWLNLQTDLLVLLKKKPHLVVLPEMFLGSPRPPQSAHIYLESYHLTIMQFKKWAKKFNIAFYTSVLKKKKNQFFNTGIWIDQNGIKSYDKIHLFKPDGEDKFFTAGHTAKIFKTKFGKVLPCVCYDLRFAELFRAKIKQKPRILLVVAQWPNVRQNHWDSLLVARAIENQAFVVAVNRRGEKNGLQFDGGSKIISPWGDVLIEIGKNKAYGLLDIDLNEVDLIRQKFNVLGDIKINIEG